jgi:hypothetical protein
MNFATGVVTALSLALLLAGCRAARPDYAVDGARRELAIAAAHSFGEALNRGACQSIYDDASEVFRGLESAEEWTRECLQMRKQLGSWKGMSIRQVTAGGAGVTVLRGTAQFERGTYCLRVDFLDEGGRARLFLLELDGGVGGFVAPRLRFPDYDRQHADPPGRFSPNHA